MSASQVDDVRDLAAPAVAAAGLVLEGVSISQAGRRRVVRVVVDLPEDQLGGVPMDAVAEASQAVSAALDAGSALGQLPYVLEVTSPGVDRPLTERRHWMRARRRLVEVRSPDGTRTTGRLVAVDAEGIDLQADPGPVRLAWDQVERGTVQIEFAAIGGADEADGTVEADEADEPAEALDDEQPAGHDRPSGHRRR